MKVIVTRAQVDAARAMVRRDKRLGRESRRSVVRIAEATVERRGHELRSERIDVPGLGFRPMGDGEWEDGK